MRTRQRRRRCGCWPVNARSLFTVALVLLVHGALMPGCAWSGAPPLSPAARGDRGALVDATESLGLARTHWPLTTGVPFPAGVVRDVSQLSVKAGEAAENATETPSQTRVLSRWPDGSVRWALVDWQADLSPRQQRRFRVAVGAPNGAASSPPAQPVKVADRGDRIEVDTGPLQFAVPKNRFAILSAVRMDGHPALDGPVTSFFGIDGTRADPEPPSSVVVTEPGPLRCRVEMRGQYASTFDYVVRLDAYANQPFVRVLHTFEQHGVAAYTTVRQISVEVPITLADKAGYAVGRDAGQPWSGTLTAKGFRVVQEDNEAVRVDGVRHAGRSAGWAEAHDATRGVAVASRFFWQEYPQSLALKPTGLTYNLWAPEAPPAKVGMGTAKTHEMVFYFFHAKTAPTVKTLHALTEPLPARVDPAWIASTGALPNSIASGTATASFLRQIEAGFRRYTAHAATERWDDSGQVSCPDAAHERPRQGFFGMFNWGYWNFPGYHDKTKGCDAWGNLEYDLTQVLALAYAATGKREYYDGMVAAARHFMDVDRITWQRQHPEWIGMNHPKNPLHFAFELGGPDPGHTWTEGLLSYYALTGDERALAAVRGIADYLVRRLHKVVIRGNPRQWGWPQIALIAAYEGTGTVAYKQAAEDYARQGMAAHPADKIDHWKVGILAEALSYTHAVTHDTAIRDWLMRYAAAVRARSPGDPRFYPAVAYVGRLTGNADDVRAAMATVDRLKFGDWGKPLTLAGRIGFRILSQSAPAPPLPAQ